MKKKDFAVIKKEIQKVITDSREEGLNNDNIRCRMIGYLTAEAGGEYERIYTESQLLELFDMVFERKAS